jgi:hypothetical protein
LDKIKKFPKKIPAGEDNRADILHEARFLGGHTCGHTEIWLQARKQIGLTGLDPISRYDSECIGMSSHINNFVWSQLHNPGSREISIRMLSPHALKEARGASDKDEAAVKKDFDDITEMVTAMNTLTHAVHCIHPWNFSVVTLDFFLNTVQYGERETATKSSRISFLCDFIDDVLHYNAAAWDDSKPFLSASELSSRWMTASMMKLSRPGTSRQNNKNENSNQRKTNNENGSPPAQNRNRSRAFIAPGHCRRWNFNACPNQNDKTCPAPWDQSKMLKHSCGFYDENTKKVCDKPHTFLEHK